LGQNRYPNPRTFFPAEKELCEFSRQARRDKEKKKEIENHASLNIGDRRPNAKPSAQQHFGPCPIEVCLTPPALFRYYRCRTATFLEIGHFEGRERDIRLRKVGKIP
jgi:hypothetical protein